MRTAAKARASRLARDLRWELVHAAGCVFREDPERCATVGVVSAEGVNVYLEECASLGVGLPVVKVPRSLRAVLGATVGGRTPSTTG